ncbi:16837_t:CDS:1 [Funneliformis mosseae]|uniref:16837_t:CDS:1 n=1 Tax=Funneliformis mosseae TaxID=27381 RepID=A0A9N9HIJ0_FUNMO|nr:16837_t:CDS:1 [Funneliformis mosseae]
MFSEECTRPKHKRKFWYHKNNEKWLKGCGTRPYSQKLRE